MECGDAVDRGRSDNRQMSHADVFRVALFDDAHTPEPVAIVGIAAGEFPQKAGIDLIDDLQVTRKQPLQHGDGPFLERFGQDGVIGIARRSGRDPPRLIPSQSLAIHEKAHQLRNDKRGVGVVQLHENLIRKALP